MSGDARQEYLILPVEPGEVKLLRLSTTIGRPLGLVEFVTRLEEQTGRRLRPMPVGRLFRDALL